MRPCKSCKPLITSKLTCARELRLLGPLKQPHSISSKGHSARKVAGHRPRVHMEGADDLLQPDEINEDQPVLPAVLTPKASAVRAVKKNDWALRSVLKGSQRPVYISGDHQSQHMHAQEWLRCR